MPSQLPIRCRHDQCSRGRMGPRASSRGKLRHRARSHSQGGWDRAWLQAHSGSQFCGSCSSAHGGPPHPGGRLSHSGHNRLATAGGGGGGRHRQLPPAIPTTPRRQGRPTPCAQEYWANEAQVAPGVGNRLHSLHGPHPAPLGPQCGGMGVQRLLWAPLPAGSSRLKASSRTRVSVLDPLPEMGPAAQTCSDTPPGRSWFYESFAKPSAGKLCSRALP